MIGSVYGKLVVLKRVGSTKQGKTTWECKCECGKTKTVVSGSLKSGLTRSCGCIQKEIATINCLKKTKHNHSGKGATRTYISWKSMKDRCYNTKSPSYKYCGYYGITVCDSWLNSFENFLADMGERPQGKSIDRIDNFKGYSKDNCKWSTVLEQNRNKKIHQLKRDCND